MTKMPTILRRAYKAVLRRLGIATHSWKDLENFDESWKGRIRMMAEMIPEEAGSVLDVGCGKMWLKEYLPPGCRYQGLDYVSRGEGSMVCDLNRGEFPPDTYDVIFVSGCLEYVEDVEWFLGTVASRLRQRLILSYCVLDHFDNLPQRRASAWVNDLRESDLLEACEAKGLRLIKKMITPSADRVFVFEPVVPKAS